MDLKIKLSSEAIKEIHESYEWYEDRSLGLGEQFIEFMDHTLKLVLQNPEGYPNKIGPYREIVFSKFPYLIVYEFVKEANTIYVLHIIHTKRNPAKKYKRK